MLVIIFISIYFKTGLKSLPNTVNTQKTEEPSNDYSTQETYKNQYDVRNDYRDAQINSIPSEEVALQNIEENELIEEPENIEEEEYDSELIEQILKEIEMDKK